MRRLWRILVWIVGIAVFLSAFGFWQWQRLLDQLVVEDVQWNLHRLGLNQLQLQRLSFTVSRNNYELAVTADDLVVQWRWAGFMPKVTSIGLRDGYLVVNKSTGIKADESEGFTLAEDWRLPQAIPEHILIERLRADIPCASGRCVLTSHLRSVWLHDVLTLQLRLLDSPDIVTANIIYESSRSEPSLRFGLIAPDFLQLHGETDLSVKKVWRGQTRLDAQPPGEEWLAYLQRWYPSGNIAPVDAFDQPAQMSTEWELALSSLLSRPGLAISSDETSSLDTAGNLGPLLAAVRARVQGGFKLTLDLPAPVPVPGVGGLSGRADIDLAVEADTLTSYLLDLDLDLKPVTLPESLTPYDINIDQLQLTLNSRSEELVNLRALPLRVSVVGEGNIQFVASGTLLLDSENPAIQIPDADLRFSVPEWSPVAELTLANLDLETRFTATWQPGAFSYALLQPGQLRTDITSADLAVKGGKLVIDHLMLSGDPASWLEGELQTNATLTVKQLVQAQLHPQPWRWQGEIKIGSRQALLQGKLTANESLTLEHKLILDDQRWLMDWQLPDIFLLAGNSLQLLTPHWPALLTLQRGRLGGDGQLSAAWADGSPLTGRANLRLADVAGIYDTTAFSGASGKLDVVVTADSLKVASENLTATEIIQGFTIGAVRAAVAYTAPMINPAAGQLRIDLLQSALLGGSVEIPATTLDFAKPEQLLHIEITELDLARLLAEHPSSDLTGSGRLSGRVPLTLSAQGFSVTGGKLTARPPGGHLQYRSARATDLAASSQGMKIITDALDDFHYTLLSSEVSYDASGTLLLGVRLEGKNPAVEAGRPINFNINLEEDLPALIYSLQLTNQLNEIIKKRIQEKLQAKPQPQP